MSATSAPVGLIRLSQLAAENGVTLRALKRRLLKLDRRIRNASPEGPFILVQHGEDGSHAPYYADASVLFMHARGYLHRRLEKSPLDEIRDLLREMREDQLAMARAISLAQNDLSALRFALKA